MNTKQIGNRIEELSSNMVLSDAQVAELVALQTAFRRMNKLGGDIRGMATALADCCQLLAKEILIGDDNSNRAEMISAYATRIAEAVAVLKAVGVVTGDVAKAIDGCPDINHDAVAVSAAMAAEMQEAKAARASAIDEMVEVSNAIH